VREIARRQDVESIAGWLLGEAKRYPDVGGADVFYVAGVGSSLSLRDGEIEEDSSGLSCGIGLRSLLSDGRQGVAFVNGLDRRMMESLAEWSVHNARTSVADPHVGLSDLPDRCDAPNLDVEDEAVYALKREDRLREAHRLHAMVAEKDPRIVSVRSAFWHDGWGESFYANTNGSHLWHRGTGVGCGVTLVMQDGEDMEMGGSGEELRFLEDLRSETVAALAVEHTARTLGGRPVPTGKYTLVLSREVTAALLDELGELFLASNVQKGRSLLKGKMGSVMAPPCLSIVDDGRLPRQLGTAPFDGEGMPTGRTLLLDRGRVAAFLYDLRSARIDGARSTGNGTRGISSVPDVGATNLFLLPGAASLESLLRDARQGLYVTELLGLHTVDTVSGEFSLGAKGVVIREGSLAEPFAGVTMAGNLLEFLERIVAVGEDLKFFGSTGACSLVVRDVSVAGS
jgi:PmbA protein